MYGNPVQKMYGIVKHIIPYFCRFVNSFLQNILGLYWVKQYYDCKIVVNLYRQG